MKTTCSILLYFILLPSVVFSQEKGNLSFTLGMAVPGGDYARADLDKRQTGFAQSGFCFDITYAYPFSKHVSAMAMFAFRNNSMNTSAYEAALEKMYSFPVYVSATGWTSQAFLIGPQGTYPLSDQFTLNAYFLFGFLSATSPEIAQTFDAPFNLVVQQFSATKTTGAYRFGVSARYDFGSQFFGLARLDLLSATPNFPDLVIDSGSGASTSPNTSYSLTMNSVNFSIGMGIRIGKRTLKGTDMALR
jgi:hypothetical protein